MARLDPKPNSETPERPQIWVEGHQQPKFKPGAWLAVGYALARRWLAPHLATTAQGLDALADQIEAGRYQVNLGWMGKAQRFVPKRRTITATVASFAAGMSQARVVLLPRVVVPEPLAYPNLIRSASASGSAAKPATGSVPASDQARGNAAAAALRSIAQSPAHLLSVPTSGSGPAQSSEPSRPQSPAPSQMPAQPLLSFAAQTIPQTPSQSPSQPVLQSPPHSMSHSMSLPGSQFRSPAHSPTGKTQRPSLSEADAAMAAVRALMQSEPKSVSRPVPKSAAQQSADPHSADPRSAVPSASRRVAKASAKATALPPPRTGAALFSPIEPAEPPRPGLLLHLGAHVIAGFGLVVALPVGLVQATLYHLNGGNLSDWE